MGANKPIEDIEATLLAATKSALDELVWWAHATMVAKAAEASFWSSPEELEASRPPPSSRRCCQIDDERPTSARKGDRARVAPGDAGGAKVVFREFVARWFAISELKAKGK